MRCIRFCRSLRGWFRAKRRTIQQRVGRMGEEVSRPFLTRNGLLPTRMEEDVGVDFVCQVETDCGLTGTRAISGKMLGVCVRSTAQKTRRIRITVDDARGMLAQSNPVLLVIVESLPKTERVHFRFLDEEFAIELAQFLESGKASTSFTPADGFVLDDYQADGFEQMLTEALRGNCAERIRLAMAKHHLSRFVPDAHLEIHRDADNELVVVDTGDFFGYFMRSTVPRQDDVYTAAFGAPRLLDERLDRIGIRPDIAQSLGELGDTAVVSPGYGKHNSSPSAFAMSVPCPGGN